ncbi:MAG: hypothetical protein IGS48_07260 [Oscillatoriales cyanobacterium C42_A2020_001]|nr:hypothetical protein [Leptolyngbyaceae cyanobacterium C42_A2020_001]
MKSSVLPSALLSCTVFSGLTAPLAILGPNSVNIEFQRENIFAGRLKDIATPYLGIAALASLGAGAVSLSVSEWRRSTRKSVRVETQLVELQKELKEKASQIDELRLSSSYLSASGLQSFLEPDTQYPMAVSDQYPTTVQEKVTPVAHSSAQHKPFKSSLPVEQVLQSQAFHGIVETTAVEVPKPRLAIERKQESAENSVAAVLSQVSELQNQLKQMESHIEVLQSSLQSSVQSPEPANPADSEIERLHRRLQLLELDWIRHQIAS